VRMALDTNILAYAEGINGAERSASTFDLLRRLPQDAIVIPVQVLGELFNVLVRKARKSRREACDSLLEWHDTFPVIETSSEIMLAALDLATAHRFAIWDAVILSAASQGGCRVLLSEDLQEGFTWGGVTVVNPFKSPPHDLLSRYFTV
jgi:predicted nucleic acid-binding protein